MRKKKKSEHKMEEYTIRKARTEHKSTDPPVPNLHKQKKTRKKAYKNPHPKSGY